MAGRSGPQGVSCTQAVIRTLPEVWPLNGFIHLLGISVHVRSLGLGFRRFEDE